jgi:predicted transporter
MELNLVLWLGGMFFTLAAFVVKVGCGLGWGSPRWPWVLVTLCLYIGLFILAAILCGTLLTFLEPVVKQGPWLHLCMAVGMMAWGVYIFRHSPAGTCDNTQSQMCGSGGPSRALRSRTYALLFLILPCPVCLTAVVFSTWAAMQVLKWPSWSVGLALGLTFTVMTLITCFLFRHLSGRATGTAGSYGLGLFLLGLGGYYLASLFLPAQIEAAKSIYQSFVTDNSGPALIDQLGAVAIFVVALLLGFLAKGPRGVAK